MLMCLSQHVPANMLCRNAENTLFKKIFGCFLFCYAIPNLTLGGWGHTKVLLPSLMHSQYERAMNVN